MYSSRWFLSDLTRYVVFTAFSCFVYRYRQADCLMMLQELKCRVTSAVDMFLVMACAFGMSATQPILELLQTVRCLTENT